MAAAAPMSSRLPRLAVHAITAALGLVLCCGSAGAADSESSAAEPGRTLYDRFGCYQCHGHFGQGGIAGPGLAPDPLPFEAFEVFVRTPAARMPPYTENVLSDEELRGIHRYLRSLPEGPPASDIPLLDLGVQPPTPD